MKLLGVLYLFKLTFLAAAARSDVSPVQKVVQLLGNLEMKIIKDGEEEKKSLR